jgi:hypothetical protein
MDRGHLRQGGLEPGMKWFFQPSTAVREDNHWLEWEKLREA